MRHMDALPLDVRVTVPTCQREVPPRAASSAADAGAGEPPVPGIATTLVPLRSCMSDHGHQ